MIEWAVTSSVLIAVVIALRFLFRRKISRRLQYALWGLVLLRLLMPIFLFGSTFSVMNVLPDSKIGENQVYVLPVSKQPVEESSGVSLDYDRVMDANSFGYAVLSEDGSTVTRYADRMSISQILALAWLAGSIAVGLWFTGANLIFYGRLRNTREARSVPDCKLPAYVTGHVASPCLFGIIRPAIYLTPKAVASADSTRHVLAHELCHYRHGDHIWSMLRCLCLAVWWWNPLVWAAAILSRTDGELACDEAAIKSIGQENRFSYGHTPGGYDRDQKGPRPHVCRDDHGFRKTGDQRKDQYDYQEAQNRDLRSGGGAAGSGCLRGVYLYRRAARPRSSRRE